MPDQTDEKLVELVKKGDDSAFGELMRRHVGAIFNLARQYARNEEDIDDIVQESFFKAWKHIKRFDAKRSFRPWLYAIARNTALDYLKKRRANSFSELDDADNDLSFADTLEDSEPLQTELFARKELAAELDVVMEDLHPDHRGVLVMRYREGLSFDEIAETFDRPMNTVKSWHRRALLKLRDKLPHRKP